MVRAQECGTAVPDVSMDENNIRGGLKTQRFVCSTPSNQITYTDWMRGKFQIVRDTPTTAINESINTVGYKHTYSHLSCLVYLTVTVGGSEKIKPLPTIECFINISVPLVNYL